MNPMLPFEGWGCLNHDNPEPRGENQAITDHTMTIASGLPPFAQRPRANYRTFSLADAATAAATMPAIALVFFASGTRKLV